jgi:putative sterol carrier protein
VRIEDGEAFVEGVEGEADCTLRADPEAMLLVGYGRMGKWRAAATGKLLVGGRRPWRALAFDRSFLRP